MSLLATHRVNSWTTFINKQGVKYKFIGPVCKVQINLALDLSGFFFAAMQMTATHLQQDVDINWNTSLCLLRKLH